MSLQPWSQKIIERLTTWSETYLWTQDTLTQVSYLTFSFVVGWVLYRFILFPPLSRAIEGSKLSHNIQVTLKNIKRLLFPATVLIITFLASRIFVSISPEAPQGLSINVMKLLLVWIVVRGCLQFITNKLVRNIFATTIWTIAAFSILGVLDETTEILDMLGFNIGEARISALGVIKGAIAIFMLLYVALFASKFFERKISSSPSLTRSSQVLINKIIRTTLIAFAVLIGLTSAGIDLSAFTIFSGALGLGIGFGLQKVVSNLFSGMLLLMDKSINPGDVIELNNDGGSTFGWVNHMGARFTEIVTRDNKSFLIPNEDFITQRVINWSHGNSLVRLQIKFGVHYDSDPHKVSTIAKKAAMDASSDRISKTPEPVCWLTEFGDSALNFSLRFWIKDAEKGVTNIKGTVMLALWDAFKENDISIPYPHREVLLHTTGDKER